MKTIPINERMSQVIERIDREEYEKFKQECTARQNKKLAEKNQNKSPLQQNPATSINSVLPSALSEK